MKFLSILLSAALPLALFSAEKVVVEQDFETCSPGPYESEMLHADWENVEWDELFGRTAIVVDESEAHHKVLEVLYPKASVGPHEGGAQFIIPLEPADEYWLSYDFKLSADYDFRLGGKLPGLTSGGAQYTGGNKPDKGQGWSARYMWREHGQMVLYLYSFDMKGKWGDDYPFNMPVLERGRWYSVKQHIRINALDRPDALIEVWIDEKKVLNLTGIRLRLQDLGQIDSFFFSTFFGGNTPEWGPLNDCKSYFDNFRIWKD